MAPLRWGILGTARINRLIIPALRASKRNSLTTVASRTPERARAYAEEWRIPRAVAPYEALIGDRDIDVVYIPLPNSQHAEWTVRALEAGKHVLCEKPMGQSVDEIDRIAAAASRTGLIAAEAFMYRHHPLTQAAVTAVANGAVGQPRVIRGAFTFTIAPGNIRLDAALGGGSLWDVGCYPVTYSCLLAGSAPGEVFGWQRTNEAGVDLAFSGLMRFDRGLIAEFDCGFEAPFRAEMEIVGSDAVLRIEQPFRTSPESRLLLVRDGTARPLPFHPDPPFNGEMDDMAAAVLDGRAPRVSLAESRRTAQVLTALYESARSGTPVTL